MLQPDAWKGTFYDRQNIWSDEGEGRDTLFKAVEVRLKFCSEVALALAFLYNVCLAHRDFMEEPELRPKEPGACLYILAQINTDKVG